MGAYCPQKFKPVIKRHGLFYCHENHNNHNRTNYLFIHYRRCHKALELMTTEIESGRRFYAKCTNSHKQDIWQIEILGYSKSGKIIRILCGSYATHNAYDGELKQFVKEMLTNQFNDEFEFIEYM